MYSPLPVLLLVRLPDNVGNDGVLVSSLNSGDRVSNGCLSPNVFEVVGGVVVIEVDVGGLRVVVVVVVVVGVVEVVDIGFVNTRVVVVEVVEGVVGLVVVAGVVVVVVVGIVVVVVGVVVVVVVVVVVEVVVGCWVVVFGKTMGVIVSFSDMEF